jgi:molybdate/tungstate transport system ATP-binding protein
VIVVNNLTVHAGAFSIANVSFEVPAGAYGVLMGKTGSGKTTLLEALCGLRRAASGSIEFMGRDVTRLKPAERGAGYVPQDRALFSTMTIREHLAFALVLRKWKDSDIEARVDELAQMLGLSKLLDRKPQGLSGGEAQRVALGRALACRPGILILDEPLSALDEETRQEMYALFKIVREQSHVTALHVTHSRTEAELLGDKIFSIERGAFHEKTSISQKRLAGEVT